MGSNGKMADSKIAIISVLVVFLVVAAGGFGAYYQNSNDLSNQVGTLNSEVSHIEADPSTETIYSTVTSTSVSFTPVTVIITNNVTVTYSTTSTSISTTDIYPSPENVTVFFASVNGDYNYAINAGSISYNGGSNQYLNFSITPAFQGETISITAGITAGIGGCFGYNQVSALLYVNSSLVSRSSTVCGTSGISISYIL